MRHQVGTQRVDVRWWTMALVALPALAAVTSVVMAAQFESMLLRIGSAFAAVSIALVPAMAWMKWNARRLMAARDRQASDTVENLRQELDDLRRQQSGVEALLARERDANRLKDAFLSAMSHELRTPLQGIAGWVQILGASRPDERTLARGIAAISRNVQALTRVISELVDVSHVVTGTMQLTFDLMDLRAPVRAAIETVRPAAQARHIVLDVHLPDAPCYITGDRERLQHVISTLLTNAVRSTQTGGVVSVILTRDGAEYRLDLMDTGEGISPDVALLLFERGQPSDAVMTREHGRVSLCLAVVKELAELHGGSVNASSEGLDDGSAIAIRLPALAEVPITGPWTLNTPPSQAHV